MKSSVPEVSADRLSLATGVGGVHKGQLIPFLWRLLETQEKRANIIQNRTRGERFHFLFHYVYISGSPVYPGFLAL